MAAVEVVIAKQVELAGASPSARATSHWRVVQAALQTLGTRLLRRRLPWTAADLTRVLRTASEAPRWMVPMSGLLRAAVERAEREGLDDSLRSALLLHALPTPRGVLAPGSDRLRQRLAALLAS